MIQIKVQGRLGNQLFQYAYGRVLQEKYYANEALCAIFPEYYEQAENGFENGLRFFNTIYSVEKKLQLNFFQKCILYGYLGIRRGVRKLFKFTPMQRYNFELHFVRMMNFFGIYILSTGYYDFRKSRFKNKVIIGPFESAKYFDFVKDDLQKEFTPVKEKEENLQLYNEITNSESVCISIRRGDFLSDRYKSNFYVCTPQYFEKAIIKMKQIVENPRFVVFSDDIEWCKENLQFPKNTLYESGKDPVEEKLRLMYSCKHFIISNSTFSWWAQYLSKNNNKVVIAPSRWKNSDSPKDIYQENWILIDPD
ncbi:alpha-1,2-fucosyltransferase [Breznakia sp. OttesenSCG-928-G09]|nr:alpha-1,2-fucosyltransferase [Breznakia sp. OttesenSCG-928-G09]